MTSPLTTIGTVVSAAKLAQGITRGLAREVSNALGFHDPGPQEIGFHDVLTGAESSSRATIEKLTGLIANRLSAAGIDVNQPLAIQITSRGDLHVDGDRSGPGDSGIGPWGVDDRATDRPTNRPDGADSRAAQIESILNSDSEIAALAKQLAGSGALVGLTIEPSQGNIPHSSGGYPNW